MIKTHMGETELKGNHAEIMADYVALTSCMFDYLMDKEEMDGNQAKEYLKEAFEMGFDNKETIDKVLDKLSESVTTVIVDVLEKILEKTVKNDEPEECDSDEEVDDEPEIECDVTVIEVNSPEELLEALNGISGKAQKKDGEE